VTSPLHSLAVPASPPFGSRWPSTALQAIGEARACVGNNAPDSLVAAVARQILRRRGLA
jgi:hypothetical protein